MNTEENKLNQRWRMATELSLLRRRLMLSQSQVALKMGIPRSSVARLETGNHSVGFDLLQAYADALDADIRIVPREENFPKNS